MRTLTRRSALTLTATTAGVALVPAVAVAAPKSFLESGGVSHERRLFKGIYTAAVLGFNTQYSIEVKGWETQERFSEGAIYNYSLRGRMFDFQVRSHSRLQDTEVLDIVFKELVRRAAEMGHPKLAAASEGVHWPVWLFRTSVLEYRISCRSGFPTGFKTLGSNHTSEDLDGLVEAGKIGPVV